MIISLSAPRLTVGMSSLPGTLYGDLVRSPHGHARVNKIDTAKAAALPGESCSIGLTNVADTPLWAQEEARILTGYVLSPLMY
jgi:CO/xanthine dehydrogenase Mo-binding subunit